MFKVVGSTKVTDIAASINELTLEDWNRWKHLQDLYSSHDSTYAYGLFFSMPDDTDTYKVTVLDTTSKVAIACQPLINSLSKAFNSTPISAVFSRLRERRVIPVHTDQMYNGIHRIHIPIITNPMVYMFGRDMKLHNWKAGTMYDLDATQPHGIVNGSRFDRTHLVIDLPSPKATKRIVYETPGSTL